MSEFNYNKDFIRDKLSSGRGSRGPVNFEDLLNDALDINTQMLMRRQQFEQSKRRSDPNFFNPHIVRQNDSVSSDLNHLDDWNVFLKKKLSGDWFPFTQDGQITQETHPKSVLFEETIGPYQEEDANKVLEVLANKVLNSVFDKIQNSDLVKDEEVEIYLKEYNNKRKLDKKEDFADIYNKIGPYNLQEDYVLSDELIREYAALIDLDKEFVNNKFSFDIYNEFGMFISKRTIGLRWIYNINNIIKSLNNISFAFCNKDLALKIEDCNSGMYTRNPYRIPYMTNQQMGTINEGSVDLYALSSVNSSSIMYLKKGQGNAFHVDITEMVELRPNEYYFSINLLIDFENILKFVIFE